MSDFSEIVKKFEEKSLEKLSKKAWRSVLMHGQTGALLASLLPDEFHEQLLLAPRVGYWPNLSNPRSFNEKICNRKLYTEEDIYTTIADKWAMREYVRERAGEELLNEVYHITDDPTTIRLDELPESFVVKPTHGSGDICIIDDKSEVSKTELQNRCAQWLSESFGSRTREYWYLKIDPQIIIENRLTGVEQDIPVDYKFFVFNGEAKIVQVDINRFDNHSRRIYTTDWNPLDVELYYPKGPHVPRPDSLDPMIEVAETLGSDFDFIRVDLYETDENGIIVGELTVAPGAGHEGFNPTAFDFSLGAEW